MIDPETGNIPEAPRSPVTARSVLIGLLAVATVSVITPFNNYVLNNSDFVGNYLPTSLLLFMGVLVIIINPLLSYWRPRSALSRGELAVVMAMMLVSCAFPAGGLMRYLPGSLTGIYSHAGSNADYQRLLEQMQLPNWMFPRFDAQTVQARANDPVITGFTGRVPTDGTMLARFEAVPWARWAMPALTWGIFLLSLYGSLLALMCIFRRQWMENERLPFPIASVLSSLIEPPERGRRLNSLFRSRLFWIAFLLVFLLHGFDGMQKYVPKWPDIPLKYDISKILADPPVSAVDNFVKTQKLYFGVIGIACLIELRLSLSLWFFYLLIQVVQISYARYQSTFDDTMQNDQFFGGLLPYTAVALWVSRQHLIMVGRQMLRGAGGGEARGRYLPYAVAGWAYISCMAVQVIWLKAAGCSAAGALVLTLMVGLVFFALMRMVAESGLLYVTFTMNLNLPWQYLSKLPEAIATRTNLTTNFMSNLFSGVLTHDVRQAFAVYGTNGIAVADREYENNKRARPAIPFVLCLILAIVVGLALSGASMLYVEYNYAASLDRSQGSPINWWGAAGQPQWWTLERSITYIPPEQGPKYVHNRLGHFGVGAAVTGVLTWLRLTFAGFPLHPLGYLLALTLGVKWVWFSIMLGWMLKASILKLGGATLYRELKPLALGMILGESAAAGFWLVISFVRALMGAEFTTVQVLLT